MEVPDLFHRLGGAAAKGAELFLGMVMCMQEYKVYGYLTCTGVRVVVVLDDGDTKVRKRESTGVDGSSA